MSNLLFNLLPAQNMNPELAGKMKNETLIKSLEGMVSQGLKNKETKAGFLEKLMEAVEVVPDKKLKEDKEPEENMTFLAMFPTINTNVIMSKEEECGAESAVASVEALHDVGAGEVEGLPKISTVQQLEMKIAEEIQRITNIEVPMNTETTQDIAIPDIAEAGRNVQKAPGDSAALDPTQIAAMLQEAVERGEIIDETQISKFIKGESKNNDVVEDAGSVELGEMLITSEQIVEVQEESSISEETDSDISEVMVREEIKKPEKKIVAETAQDLESSMYGQSQEEEPIPTNLKMFQAIYNTEFIDRTIGESTNIVQDYFDLVNSRIIDSMKFALQNDIQTISIDLTPDTLGAISISISSGADGVEAKISVSSKLTNDILTQNIGELHSAIESHGVQLKNLDINLSRQNEAQPEQQQQKHQEPQQNEEQQNNKRQNEVQINYQNILRSFLEEDLSDG